MLRDPSRNQMPIQIGVLNQWPFLVGMRIGPVSLELPPEQAFEFATQLHAAAMNALQTRLRLATKPAVETPGGTTAAPGGEAPPKNGDAPL